MRRAKCERKGGNEAGWGRRGGRMNYAHETLIFVRDHRRFVDDSAYRRGRAQFPRDFFAPRGNLL